MCTYVHELGKPYTEATQIALRYMSLSYIRRFATQSRILKLQKTKSYLVKMSSSSEDEVPISWYFLRKKVLKRRYSVHPYFMNNVAHSEAVISEELQKDEQKFKEFYRMNKENFADLCQLLETKLRKKDTNYKKAIEPKEKMLITLRYLATGRSFRDLSYTFYRGETTIGKIIKETCKAIWDTLQPLVMRVPNKDIWQKIARDFCDISNLPNCLGSIDGKHIRIKKFPNTGSSYINYKGYFSIVLLACADAHGMFTMIDVGDMGRNSDGSVFRSSHIGQFLESTKSCLLKDEKLINDMDGRPFPHYFIGDEAFPLKTFLMRPYPRSVLNSKRRIFNYRLSRARKSVECAFGMLTSKFRIFEKPITLTNVNSVIDLVKASCVLHNFIRAREGILGKVNKFEIEKEVPELNCPEDNYKARNKAMENRDYLMNYFVKPAGSIPIQWAYA